MSRRTRDQPDGAGGSSSIGTCHCALSSSLAGKRANTSRSIGCAWMRSSSQAWRSPSAVTCSTGVRMPATSIAAVGSCATDPAISSTVARCARSPRSRRNAATDARARRPRATQSSSVRGRSSRGVDACGTQSTASDRCLRSRTTIGRLPSGSDPATSRSIPELAASSSRPCGVQIGGELHLHYRCRARGGHAQLLDRRVRRLVQIGRRVPEEPPEAASGHPRDDHQLLGLRRDPADRSDRGAHVGLELREQEHAAVLHTPLRRSRIEAWVIARPSASIMKASMLAMPPCASMPYRLKPARTAPRG